jgi:hypothetical protein
MPGADAVNAAFELPPELELPVPGVRELELPLEEQAAAVRAAVPTAIAASARLGLREVTRL